MKRYRDRDYEGYANRLAQGVRIQNLPDHHTGMAILKARRGDPRPEGMTLSLVNPWGPSTYWGYCNQKPHRLSTDPDDYIWETQAENNRRRVPDLTLDEMRARYLSTH